MTATAVRIVGITIETACQRCGRTLRLTVPPEDVPVLNGQGALCGGCERDEGARSVTSCSANDRGRVSPVRFSMEAPGAGQRRPPRRESGGMGWRRRDASSARGQQRTGGHP
jgi:hypothetical protein